MVYVISDLHGNLQSFLNLIERIHFSDSDIMYILGDTIDPNKDGIELLKYIMGKKNIIMLLGNHEYMFLNSVMPSYVELPWKRPDREKEFETWMANGGSLTYAVFNELPLCEQRKICNFLIGLPLSVDISINGIGFKLVHAAPKELYGGRYSSGYRDSTEFAVWHRFNDFSYIPDLYILIFGHTPTDYYQQSSPLKIWYGDSVIGIDCGSGLASKEDSQFPYRGRIGCLRLDDMKEYYSE